MTGITKRMDNLEEEVKEVKKEVKEVKGLLNPRIERMDNDIQWLKDNNNKAVTNTHFIILIVVTVLAAVANILIK